MGVTGLWTLLEPAGKRVSVDTLRNKKVAVDASIWLVQFLKAMTDANSGDTLAHAHLLGFFRRLIKLMHLSVRPIVVFDGATPALKRRTLAERRRRREVQERRLTKAAEKLLGNRIKAHLLQKAKEAVGSMNQQKQKTKQTEAVSLIDDDDDDDDDDNDDGKQKQQHHNHRQTTDSQVDADARLAADLDAAQAMEAAEAMMDDKSSDDSEGEWEDADVDMLLPEDGNLDTVDPEALAHLPFSMQLDLMGKLKERRNALNRESFAKVSGQHQQFSQLQMKEYIKGTNFRAKVEAMKDSMNAVATSQGTADARRVQSEAGREYVLRVDGKKKETSPSPADRGDSHRFDRHDGDAGRGRGHGRGRGRGRGRGDTPAWMKGVDQPVAGPIDLAALPQGLPLPMPPAELFAAAQAQALQAKAQAAAVEACAVKQKFETATATEGVQAFETKLQIQVALPAETKIEAGKIDDDDGTWQGDDMDGGFFGDDGDDDDDDEWEDVVPATKNIPRQVSDGTDTAKPVETIVVDPDVDQHGAAASAAAELQSLPGGIAEAAAPESMPEWSTVTWRERMRRRQKFWSRTHGFGPGRSLGDWDAEKDDDEEPASQDDDAIEAELDALAPKIARGALKRRRAVLLDSDGDDDDGGGFEPVPVRAGAHVHWKDMSSDDEEDDTSLLAAGLAAGLVRSRKRPPADAPSAPPSSPPHVAPATQADTPSPSPSPPPPATASVLPSEPAGTPSAPSSPPPATAFVLPSEPAGTPSPAAPAATLSPLPSPSSPATASVLPSEPAGTPSPAAPAATLSPSPSPMSPATASVLPSEPAGTPSPAAPAATLSPSPSPISPATASVLPSEPAGTPSFVRELQENDTDAMLDSLAEEREGLRAEMRSAAAGASEVSAEMFADVQDMLSIFGIPFIVAPAEAEAQCAWLNANGFVDAVITDDADAFVFGSTEVYRHIFSEKNYVERYRLRDIEHNLHLTVESMRLLALLLGSDYTEGVTGVGVVNAVEILQSHGSIEALGEFKAWVNSPDLSAFERALGVTARSKTSTSDSATDEAAAARRAEFRKTHNSVRKRWVIPADFPSEKVVQEYRSPPVDSSLASLVAAGDPSAIKAAFHWGTPDLPMLRKMCLERFGWEHSKTDDLVLPAVHNFEARNKQRSIEDFAVSFTSDIAKFKSKRLANALKGLAKEGSASRVVEEMTLLTAGGEPSRPPPPPPPPPDDEE